MLRVALTLGLLAVPASTAEAAAYSDAVGVFSNEVHVVNNYQGTVRVYAEDAFGRLHRLGRVQQGQIVTFEIPATVTEHHFRIKVFPTEFDDLREDDFGVKTNPLDAESISMLTIWVEADLTQSKVEVDRG
jgi:hypothetical protein